jgi:dTDP-4-amino-4,6-dideoxygalactose transaminase
MQVAFLDLAAQHRPIRSEIDRALRTTVDTSAFIQGPEVRALEAELAQRVGTRHAVGVASCTAALSITLRGLGIGPGDEVITTPLTAVPTAEAVGLAGGRAVFADVDEEGWLLDPRSVESRIGGRTRAILPVHLHGMSARIDELADIARRHGLALVEDIAQALGASFHGKPLGGFGRASCASFFPSKPLGGFGDGGMIFTDDEALADFAASYSNHGRREKLVHDFEGANERLDALQAAVLRVKLPYLDEWNARRRAVADRYRELLADVEEIRLPRPLPDTEPVWHVFAIRCEDRDGVRRRLAERGVQTGLHYPLPLHLQPAYGWMELGRGSLPVAERICDELLSLPMHPELTAEEIEHVAGSVKAAVVRREGVLR